MSQGGECHTLVRPLRFKSSERHGFFCMTHGGTTMLLKMKIYYCGIFIFLNHVIQSSSYPFLTKEYIVTYVTTNV